MASIFHIAKRILLGHDTRLHPLDHRMAKEWVKRRLKKIYPELAQDPQKLEAAYRSLNLTGRPGQTEEEPETVFEMSLPGEPERD